MTHNRLPLKINPDPFLRKKSKPFDLVLLNTPDMRKFFKLFIQTLHEDKGVGLAAPQVGEHWRIIAVQIKDKAQILVNPEITKFSKETDVFEEGCLSVPGVYGMVRRPANISVRGFDELGQPLEFPAMGMLARVIQHEVDHLDGILFIDKVFQFTEV